MISKLIQENKLRINPQKSIFCLIIFLTVIFLGLPFSLVLAYFSVFNRRVYPRVFVCQQEITGKTQKEALETVNQTIKNLPEKINLSLNEKNYTLGIDQLTYRPEITVQKALRLGREKNPILNIKTLYQLYKNSQNLPVDYYFDEVKLDDAIATLSATLYEATVNPEIKIIKGGGKTISIEPGKDGHEVDKRQLKTAILKQLDCPQKEISLPLPLVINSPKVSAEMASKTKERATLFLDKDIVLKLDDQSWKINDEEIISFLTFDNQFDRNKISSYVSDFSKTINSQPENATFQFDNNLVSVFKPSKDGIALKESEFVENLIQKLSDMESSKQNQELIVPVTKTSAKVSTGDANTLGIKELIGKGTSLFYGSINERIHNLQLASLRLNGILIAPDEAFSFNKNLGDVSADTGFKQAYIIKAGRTVLGDGGGVCQVSTTLFRAALNSGLPIIERHAHAYRVHYYEDDLGPGLDATVFDPSADLKIKNDTGNYILIQTSLDLKKKQLTFELYGSKDGREATIGKVRVWDKQPPPPDVYQDDPTLSTGTMKQVDWKAWGAKAAFDYKVTKDGTTLFEKTFTSVYKPWAAVYLRGTGK